MAESLLITASVTTAPFDVTEWQLVTLSAPGIVTDDVRWIPADAVEWGDRPPDEPFIREAL